MREINILFIIVTITNELFIIVTVVLMLHSYSWPPVMFHLGVAQPALAALSATVHILNMFNIIRAAKMSLRAVEEV